MVPQPAHIISTKSKKRIVIPTAATRYYDQIGQELTTSIMMWQTLKNFDFQWMAIKEKKKQDDTKVPKLMKHGSIIKWIESFKLHLFSVIGVQNCLLIFVIRNAQDVSTAKHRPALIAYQAFCTKCGLFEEEMIALSTHDHPLF